MTDELKNKIADSDTGLQRAYGFAVIEYDKWQSIKLEAEKKMQEMRDLITLCMFRAEEQDALDVL